MLIEQIETRDGFHLFVYPFEGRLVHEAMAAVLAYRISRITPITFSIAMNDYGFELLSDQPIPVDDTNVYELFSLDNLIEDIQRSVNATEMAKRKFRDIAVIGGLIFQGIPESIKKQDICRPLPAYCLMYSMNMILIMYYCARPSRKYLTSKWKK